MAHFNNGTEGMFYTERYCEQCLNEENRGFGCVIWNLHLLLVPVADDDACVVLDYLIPREGGENQMCRWYDRLLRITDFSDALEMGVDDWKLVYDPPQDTIIDLELWHNLCVQDYSNPVEVR